MILSVPHGFGALVDPVDVANIGDDLADAIMNESATRYGIDFRSVDTVSEEMIAKLVGCNNQLLRKSGLPYHTSAGLTDRLGLISFEVAAFGLFDAVEHVPLFAFYDAPEDFLEGKPRL